MLHIQSRNGSKGKSAARAILFVFVFLSILCSTQNRAYADDNLNDMFGYNDSLIDEGAEQDNSLLFVPLPPETDYYNYILVYSPSNKTYYFYCVNESYVSWFDFYGSYVLNSDWYCYEYNSGVSNSWTESTLPTWSSGTHWIRFPDDFQVIDTTAAVSGHYGGRVMTVQKTGYRLYWSMALILKSIIGYMNIACDYILTYEILKYACLTVFMGELILFVIHLVHRVGDLQNET